MNEERKIPRHFLSLDILFSSYTSIVKFFFYFLWEKRKHFERQNMGNVLISHAVYSFVCWLSVVKPVFLHFFHFYRLSRRSHAMLAEKERKKMSFKLVLLLKRYFLIIFTELCLLSGQVKGGVGGENWRLSLKKGKRTEYLIKTEPSLTIGIIIKSHSMLKGNRVCCRQSQWLMKWSSQHPPISAVKFLFFFSFLNIRG